MNHYTCTHLKKIIIILAQLRRGEACYCTSALSTLSTIHEYFQTVCFFSYISYYPKKLHLKIDSPT